MEGDIFFFLKEIFLKRRENAAQLRIGSGGVLSQQLVTQTHAGAEPRFLELSSPAEAQQIGWLDSARSPSSRRRGSTDRSAACLEDKLSVAPP